MWFFGVYFSTITAIYDTVMEKREAEKHSSANLN